MQYSAASPGLLDLKETYLKVSRLNLLNSGHKTFPLAETKRDDLLMQVMEVSTEVLENDRERERERERE